MVQRKPQIKICPCCNQIIRSSNIYTLTKNSIKSLFGLYMLQLQTGKYFQTKDVYGLIKGCSPTAMLSQLKYFGAIERYFNEMDSENFSPNSGKWRLTQEGIKFLSGQYSLSSYIIVRDKKVVENGNLVLISDESIKWKTEDEIWKTIKEHFAQR